MALLCKTSIYIVCEGAKSEPWFLRRFIEWVKRRGYSAEYYCDIFPTPKQEEELAEDEIKPLKKNNRKTSGRRITNASPVEVEQPPKTPIGGNPLYWVEYGFTKLSSYSEVYVVFDKDGHPKIEDAFGKVEKAKNANIEIIFNSRSFEYYMLMHFERLYKSFEQTECGERHNKHKRSYYCGLPNAVEGKECKGEICINGYARSKGYWTDSKDDRTFFTATNIWRGMANSEYIRSVAVKMQGNLKVYELNPYTDFQKLLTRLMDMKLLRSGVSIDYDAGRGEFQRIIRNGNTLQIVNDSSVLKINLKDDWLQTFSFPLDYITFEDFRKNFATEADAINSFAAIQDCKTIISSEPALTIDCKDSIEIPVFFDNSSDKFAVLSYMSISYLILPEYIVG